MQQVGSWLLLGGLRELGFCDLAAQHRGEVPGASLRAAIDATAISLALGEGSVEGVRRISATCQVENVRSLRVLQKLGMRCEGRFRHEARERDGLRDSYHYVLRERDVEHPIGPHRPALCPSCSGWQVAAAH